MTPEEKAAAAKARAEEKAKADHLRPEVLVQFQESEASIDALVETAKADIHKTKKRKGIVFDMDGVLADTEGWPPRAGYEESRSASQ